LSRGQGLLRLPALVAVVHHPRAPGEGPEVPRRVLPWSAPHVLLAGEVTGEATVARRVALALVVAGVVLALAVPAVAQQPKRGGVLRMADRQVPNPTRHPP